MHPPRPLATFADLLELGDDVRAEVLDGRVIVAPPPLPEHGRAQLAIGRVIGGAFDADDGRGGPGDWWIAEVDIELSRHDVVRPDVAGWRRQRLPSPWGQRPLKVAPDWVCEIVSPSRPAHDRVRKRWLYAAHGVAFYWIVDPAARTLEALRLDPSTKEWREIGAYDDADRGGVRIAPFDAAAIEVRRLFSPLDGKDPGDR